MAIAANLKNKRVQNVKKEIGYTDPAGIPSVEISSLKLYLTPIAISVIGLLLYWPSVYYGFQFDDLANILKFFNIRSLTLGRAFFSNSRWVSSWLNANYYAIGKFESFYYRLGNICFHLTTGLVVYCMIWLMLSRQTKNKFLSNYAYPIATIVCGFFVLILCRLKLFLMLFKDN